MRSSHPGARIIATWFGIGYWPWGPGTAGSAAAVLIAMALGWEPWWFAVLALGLIPVSVWAAGREAEASGRTDPGHIVVDEVAGQWITLSAASQLGWAQSLAAFLLFRFFDIVKPAPARQLEALDGGLGIMADDIMAGLYGAAVLLLVRWLNFL